MISRLACAGILAFAGTLQAADDPCGRFKWDVSQEVALYRTAGTPLVAGATSADSPVAAAGTLYALTLHPQEHVKLQVPTSKKMLDDGAFAGLVKLRLRAAGAYRISVDSGFWLDVADGERPLPSKDFSGSQNCQTPRKVVLYDLPADSDLYLQLTGASSASAKLTIVRASLPAP